MKTWYSVDFKVIDHTSDDPSPIETTMIFAESLEIAAEQFALAMLNETYDIIGIRISNG